MFEIPRSARDNALDVPSCEAPPSGLHLVLSSSSFNLSFGQVAVSRGFVDPFQSEPNRPDPESS